MKPGEVEARVRSELTERLAGDGWTPGFAAFALIAFIKPLSEEFAATVSVTDGLPEFRPHVFFGVAYEPLRRLAPLLGRGFALHVWHVDAEEDPAEADDELEDEDEDPDDAEEIRTPAQVTELCEHIVGLVRDHGTDFAAEHGSVEALLGEDPDEGDVHLMQVAILAAARRFDEAERLLGAWSPDEHMPSYFEHEERVLARRLRRWIDSRGDPALMPADFPPERSSGPSANRPSVVALWREVRAQDAAVKAVAEARGGRSRDELRTMLRDELARRSVSASPLWIEARLDQLGATKAEQWQAFGRALLRIGRGIAKAIDERSLPDLEPPAWLAPPDFAGYPLPRTRREAVGVVIDDDAFDYLARIYDAVTTVLDIARLEAWLSWDGESDDGHRRLAVGLGTRLVGEVAPDAVARYLPAMEAAATRDEVPYVDARIIRRPPPDRYLLEIDAAP
jgi:hypothetical protein